MLHREEDLKLVSVSDIATTHIQNGELSEGLEWRKRGDRVVLEVQRGEVDESLQMLQL